MLFHSGFQVIRDPDIRIGRKNADFGQGFYLSDKEEFCRRWARERKGLTTYLNRYEIVFSGLNVKHFIKDEEWFNYIFENRAGRADALSEYDVIIGPIANDTIYDTWGIITSGQLKREQALQLLMIGPCYEQTVIKSDKALEALSFIDAAALTSEEIWEYRAVVRQEEELYQEQFAELLNKLLE